MFNYNKDVQILKKGLLFYCMHWIVNFLVFPYRCVYVHLHLNNLLRGRKLRMYEFLNSFVFPQKFLKIVADFDLK